MLQEVSKEDSYKVLSLFVSYVQQGELAFRVLLPHRHPAPLLLPFMSFVLSFTS
jgi:hypothetical protein